MGVTRVINKLSAWACKEVGLTSIHATSDWWPLQYLHLQEKKNRKEKLESDVAMCR